MRWSDVPRNPTDKVLRQFAGLSLVIFGALSAWNGLVKDRPTAGWIFLAMALAIGPIGLIRPRLVRPIFVGWMILAFPIGWLVSNVALALIYFGLFTPLALLFRLTGRDPLRRRTRPRSDTYYLPKATPTDLRSYLRQY